MNRLHLILLTAAAAGAGYYFLVYQPRAAAASQDAALGPKPAGIATEAQLSAGTDAQLASGANLVTVFKELREYPAYLPWYDVWTVRKLRAKGYSPVTIAAARATAGLK